MAHRLWLARAISVVHGAVVLLFVVGWALPWRQALWAVVLGATVVQAGWWLFGNRCLLTVAEARLRGSPAGGVTLDDAHFVRDLAERVLGRRPSERWLELATYGVMWGAFAIAAARLGLRL